MKIIIRKSYKTINPFELDNVPDFVVLTGENGTGKTQLLECLYHSATRDEKNDMLRVNETPVEEYRTGDESNEDAKEELLSAAELSDGKQIYTNVVYREVQAPNVEVGGKFDLKALYSEGESIAQKHLFYKTRPMGMEDVEDENELTSAFQKAVGLKKGVRISTDTILPSISKMDIDIIKKIESEFSSNDYSKDPYYYIAFQPVPKSTVFAANLKFLYFQHWARLEAGLPVGVAPWEAFNDMGKTLNFKFELDEPKIVEKKFDVRLRDKEKKVFISPDSLSSGEKVIFSLFVAMYSTNTTEYLPNVILFDEPDAFLHPSLCRTMIDVIQNVFIKQHGIKVIITTHSPTTVALVPEQSLYRMIDGKMVKTTKKEAILTLTTGLKTISVYYENVKQIFVEANNDNLYLSYVSHYATQHKLLSDDVQLRFVNVGNTTNGGCDVVKKVVNDLAAANNGTIFGIIDWDGKNVENDRIKILGNGKRYAIDNYLLDPLVLILLCVEEQSWREKIGFPQLETIVHFASKSPYERQTLVNNTISLIEQKVPFEKKTEAEIVTYSILNGQSYTIPKWYTICQGHELMKYVRDAFPFINKYTDEKLFDYVVKNIYAAYPDIIPMDVVETLKKIQEYQ